jgi:membrane-associated phospholipid phosphatase
MEEPQDRVRCLLYALLASLLLLAFSVLFVDRAASTWSHEYLRGAAFFDLLTHIVDPLRLMATLALCVGALAAIFWNWKPSVNGRTVITASLAVLVSAEIKELLKHFFGRTWPETWVDHNPSWIADQAYGFHMLHGGAGWESFPSGHTTQIAALAAVIWLRLPRIRWLGVALVFLVALGLWGSDYHFVGDILAGAFLGTACGIGMVGLVCRDGQ